jgi:MFS transporter, CP family, cyanate transporter
MKHEKIHTVAVARPALLIAGILLIAANLRVLFTGVAPLLDMIRSSFALSTSEAGMLTTLPLLAFAVMSPLSVLLARKYGLERSLFAALGLIIAGIATRSAGVVWALYLGTSAIGAGIAIGNVLLPSLLKRDFPDKVAPLTALYMLTMGIAAAAGSAVAIPLAHVADLGWRFALGAFVLLPLISAVVWLPQLRNRTTPAKGTATLPRGGPIWHAALAWQVTLFLGLNSLVYYVVVSWLPAILGDAGYTPQQAGAMHGVLQLATAVPGLALVPLVHRLKDQRIVAFCTSVLTMVSLLGLQFAPAWAIVWAILFGLGAGATIILGLMFISLRTVNSQQAASLSGMAQCIGYLLAAAGPTLVGALHDLLGGWSVTLSLCTLLCCIMALIGLLAGRAIQIKTSG